MHASEGVTKVCAVLYLLWNDYSNVMTKRLKGERAGQRCQKKVRGSVQSPCPSSPGAREPISVVKSFDLPRRKGAMMPNVSHGKERMFIMKERTTFHSMQIGVGS
jgi:hypothetical protein